MRKIIILFFLCLLSQNSLFAQINTDRVMTNGRYAFAYQDYMLAIQYFNQVIAAKPYLAEAYLYRAESKQALGDYMGSEVDCDLCVNINPYYPYVYQLRGINRQCQKKYVGAIEDYKRALKFNPVDELSCYNLALAYRLIQEKTKSDSTLHELLNLKPNNYDAQILRASFYLEDGDTIKALSSIDKALHIDKYLSKAYSLKGLIFFHKKDFLKAIENFDIALKYGTENYNDYFSRALSKYFLNNYKGALADYDKLLEYEPANGSALYNRASMYAYVGADNQAIEDYNKVILLAKDNYSAIYNRGILRSRIGDHKGAVADFSKILQKYPNFIPGYEARSQERKKIGDVKGAEKDFWMVSKLEKDADRIRKEKKIGGVRNQASDSIVSDAPNFNKLLIEDESSSAGTHYTIRGKFMKKQESNVKLELVDLFVLTYYKSEDKSFKQEFINALLIDFNKKNKLTNQLIITADETSLSEENIKSHLTSIDNLSKKIEDNPKDAKLYFARSVDFYLVKDFESAINDLNKTIEIDSTFTFAYFNRATIRLKQTNSKLTFEELLDKSQTAKALEMTKIDNKVWTSNRRTIQLQYELIINDLNIVIEKQPDFIWAYYNRANVKFLQQDFRQAIFDYNKAIELRAEFAESYYNRGLIYLYQGFHENGVLDLSKAGALGMRNAYNIIKRISQ